MALQCDEWYCAQWTAVETGLADRQDTVATRSHPDLLCAACQGNGKNTETLSINPPRVVIGSCLASLALHYFAPLQLGIGLPLLPHRAALAGEFPLRF